MKPEIQKLRSEVEAKERAFSETKKRLDEIIESCKHQFGETIPDHIYHEAYTIPGDPPGTMGVDWRGPCHVNASTEKRWKRICDYCGKTEYTQNIRKEVQVKEFPAWPEDRRNSRTDFFPKDYFEREKGWSYLDQ